MCYQIATKTMASGLGAESWGIGPFSYHDTKWEQDPGEFHEMVEIRYISGVEPHACVVWQP